MQNKNIKYYAAANWRVLEDSYSDLFHREFVSTSWVPYDSAIAEDLSFWNKLSKEDQNLIISGLLAAKIQKHFIGSYCLPTILGSIDYLYPRRKAMIASIIDRLLSTHAIALTTMIDSFASLETINNKWEEVIENDLFQKYFAQLKVIIDILDIDMNRKMMGEANLRNIGIDATTTAAEKRQDSVSSWKGYVLVILALETYSLLPFYMLLKNSNKRKFKETQETIQLILRDTTTISVYLSALALELFNNLDLADKHEMEEWAVEQCYSSKLLVESIANQFGADISTQQEITHYLEYSLNKTMYKLGLPLVYENTSMPRPVEKALQNPVGVGRYRFEYTKKEIHKTKLALLKNHIRRMFSGQ